MKKLWEKYKEIIMYLIFGVATTVVNWVCYALIEPPLSRAMHGDQVVFSLWGITLTMSTLAIFIANVIAWIVAVIFAFVTNKLWVFESKSWKLSLVMKEFWLFILARLITGVIEWVGVPLVVALGVNQVIFGVEGMLAKILVSIIVVILNYVFSKLIIFRKNKS